MSNKRTVRVAGLEFTVSCRRGRPVASPKQSRWSGRKMAALRRAMGLTQWACALKLGYSWTSISRWENDRGPIPEAVCKVFDGWEQDLPMPLSHYMPVEVEPQAQVRGASGKKVIQPLEVNAAAEDLGTYLRKSA